MPPLQHVKVLIITLHQPCLHLREAGTVAKAAFELQEEQLASFYNLVKTDD